MKNLTGNEKNQLDSERRLLAEWEDRAKDKFNIQANEEFIIMRKAFQDKWKCLYIRPRAIGL